MNCIVVVASNWAIGKKNKLLFSLPEDMKHFRSHTLGKTVVMGRKTLESFPGGKPLPKRTNLVLTRDPSYQKEGVTVCHSKEEVLLAIKDLPEEDVMIIGGAEIYRLFLPECKRAYLTEVSASVPDADSFFPEISEQTGWKLISRSEEMTEGALRYRFCTYEKEM
ncbi:dihydrofolate reductase [Hominifimenecus sp. rT4P-3]|uniref:dihydrofolate reductase n=1 Tax=Hominifimenecus sp. rT4P-3 TaxID=3242979 RepID=UPI003DA3181C